MDAISRDNALNNGTPVTVLVEEIDPALVDDEHLTNGHNGDIDWELMHRALVPRLHPATTFSATQAISPWLLDAPSPMSPLPSAATPPEPSPPPLVGPTVQFEDIYYFDSPDAGEHPEPPERERTPSPASPRTVSNHYNAVRAVVSDPAIGAQRPLTARQHTREQTRLELLSLPLNENALGRRILDLRRYRWYTMSNGLVVMRFARNESQWRANDISNSINWLRCGAYCHRSSTHNIIAVANLPALNARIARCGLEPIIPANFPPRWRYDSPRPVPGFMRHGFVSRHLERLNR